MVLSTNGAGFFSESVAICPDLLCGVQSHSLLSLEICLREAVPVVNQCEASDTFLMPFFLTAVKSKLLCLHLEFFQLSHRLCLTPS